MMKKNLIFTVFSLSFLISLSFTNQTLARTFDVNKPTVQDVLVVGGASADGEKIDLNCLKIDQNIPDSVDMAKVREAWLGWNNGVREKAGLAKYALQPVLSMTGEKWSERALKLGTINHKRDGQKSYYDYKKVLAWFKDLGVEFVPLGGMTMTENIGWGYYKCPADGGDCTDNIIKAVRTTFDFFASEKKKNGAHWRSMMNKQYKEIGLGMALDSKSKKYYLTIHYATELKSKPGTICAQKTDL